ncbi:uncharacterized protein [Clytia hemisphaerica]|uniref:uncharacterized protein n=1 Tax=Clytia hemisphaerica TaxID=252671 RepID=UPI0034D4A4CA
MSRTCGPDGEWINDLKFIQSVGCKSVRSPTQFVRYRNDLILDTFKYNEDHKGIVRKLQEDAQKHDLQQTARDVSLCIRYLNLFTCCLTLVLIFWLVPLSEKRFILHRFLILGLALHDVFFILQSRYIFDLEKQQHCSRMFILSTYFHVAVLLVMFSEGFYQFRQFYFIIVTKHREPYYIVFSYVVAALIVFGVFLPGMYYDTDTEYCWSRYYWNKYRWALNSIVIIVLCVSFVLFHKC